MREEGDGVDVGLNALEGGLELRVDDLADVFDGGANLAHQLLHRIADMRFDRARDFVAPHGHKSSESCRLKPVRKRRAIIAREAVLLLEPMRRFLVLLALAAASCGGFFR